MQDNSSGFFKVVALAMVVALVAVIIFAFAPAFNSSSVASSTNYLTARGYTIYPPGLPTYPPSGILVGTTDVQTLTNKNLSSSTNTFPSSISFTATNVTNSITGTDNITNANITNGTITNTTTTNLTASTGRSVTLTVAAYNATAAERAQANYVCNNVNDGTTINTALGVLSATGGTLQLSSGLFTINTTIIIPTTSPYLDLSGIHLKGQGYGTVLKLKDGANCHVLQLGNTSAMSELMQVSDLFIDGNKAANTGTIYGIYTNGTGAASIVEAEISNVYISGCVDSGLYANNYTRYLKLLNVSSSGNGGEGFDIRAHTSTLDGGTNFSNGRNGIFVSGAEETTVTNTHNVSNSVSANSTYDGINIESTRTLVADNVCHNEVGGSVTQRYGIYLRTSSLQCVATGNICYNNNVGAIFNGGISNIVKANYPDDLNVNPLVVPTNAGWATTVTGAGAGTQYATMVFTETNASNSTALMTAPIYLMDAGNGTTVGRFDWSKKAHIQFRVLRELSDANATARFQLKGESTIGAMASYQGLGLQIDNLAMSLETFGASQATKSLSTSLTSGASALIDIYLYPGVEVDCYVNNVLKASQTTAAKIPATISVTGTWIAVSISTPVGGTDCIMAVSPITIWQYP